MFNLLPFLLLLRVYRIYIQADVGRHPPLYLSACRRKFFFGNFLGRRPRQTLKIKIWVVAGWLSADICFLELGLEQGLGMISPLLLSSCAVSLSCCRARYVQFQKERGHRTQNVCILFSSGFCSTDRATLQDVEPGLFQLDPPITTPRRAAEWSTRRGSLIQSSFYDFKESQCMR